KLNKKKKGGGQIKAGAAGGAAGGAGYLAAGAAGASVAGLVASNPVGWAVGAVGVTVASVALVATAVKNFRTTKALRRYMKKIGCNSGDVASAGSVVSESEQATDVGVPATDPASESDD
ncbi:MAG: hypothetical protein AAB425_04830, partial [Bdellovibrionota bacterium]